MQGTFVENDLATVWTSPRRGEGSVVVVLHRGDAIDVLSRQAGWVEVSLGRGRRGWINNLKTRSEGILEFAFIDVGQGDACLMTTPKRWTVLIDGGENQMAARYLAGRYGGGGADVVLDAIVVSHGDADHFAGLSTLILDAATEKRLEKRIRVASRRVFHNGLVKRSSAVPEAERLGPPLLANGRVLVPLVDDPRSVNDANKPFTRWGAALEELARRHRTEIRRLDSQTTNAFSFLDDVDVEVLGPRAEVGSDAKPYLPMLGSEDGNGLSSARTINGHSVVLKVTYGNVRTLLTGDINAAAERELVKDHDARQLSLKAELLKVPHHGSDDLSREFIRAVEPLVSVISAGDEDARRDYMHPRGNLLGLLGRADRGAEPVVFVTNLSAFDRWVGRAFRAIEVADAWIPDVARGTFYARERSTYGMVHVRTDGERLLVVRRGARKDRHEAYSFAIDAAGRAQALPVDRV